MSGNLPTPVAAMSALLPGMAAERLPYTHKVTAKGRVYWQFRSKETGELRLPGEPGLPQFHQAYGNALDLRNNLRSAAAGVRDPSSWAWLVDRYLKSTEYAALADSTQADYSRTCALLEAALGPEPFRYTTRGMLKDLRDDHAATPRKAHKVKQMASRLYSWADEQELVPEGFNPAKGFKRLKRKGGDKEIVPWSDAEIGWVLESAPAPVKTAVLLALYTGQRRRDVIAMTWQQWQGDVIRVRQAKTGALLELPCHAVLSAHLEELRRGPVAPFPTAPICVRADGSPWPSDNALSGAVRRVVEAHPRVPNHRSMHGLRYAAAARMEEGGATIAGIEAVLGHRTFKMAMKYATARLRAREGVNAMRGEV